MSYTLLIDCSDTNLSIGVSKDSNLVYKKSFYKGITFALLITARVLAIVKGILIPV